MQHEAIQEIKDASTLEGLQAIKTRYVGKSGLVTKELGSLGKLPPEERKARGAEINAIRQAIDAALRECDGNRERAAEMLDISPTTLWRKMTRTVVGVRIEETRVEGLRPGDEPPDPAGRGAGWPLGWGRHPVPGRHTVNGARRPHAARAALRERA